MKRTLLLCMLATIVLLSVPGIVRAQAWDRVYPDYNTNDVTSLVHWKGDTVFAFGLNWSIQRSDDAGATWKSIAEEPMWYSIQRAGSTGRSIILMPTANHFTLKLFSDSTRHFLFSFNPYTYDTTRITIPVNDPCVDYREFYDVSVNENCIAVLQKTTKISILISTDLGMSWVIHALPESMNFTKNYPATLLFHDSLHGLLICNVGSTNTARLAYITNDGCKTWKVVPSVEYLYNGGIGVFTKFPACWVDDSTCVVINNGNTPFVTHDGGTTWLMMARLNCEIGSINFHPDGTGYAIGQGLEAYKTTDWGSTWIQIKGGMAGGPMSPSSVLLSRDTLVVSGLDGFLYRTEDGGITWDDVHSMDIYQFERIKFFTSDKGFAWAYSRADGKMHLYKTYDGGKTWGAKYPLIPGITGSMPYYFSSELVGFARSGNAVLTNGTLIYRTVDGGQSWQSVLDTLITSVRTTYFPAVSGLQRLHRGLDLMFYYSDRGLLKTTDGGTDWVIIPNALAVTKNDFSDLYVRESGSILLLTKSNLYESTNDGLTWTGLLVIPDSLKFGGFHQIQITGDGTIYIYAWNGNYYGVLLKSTDEGSTWISFTPLLRTVLGNIQLFQSGHAFSLNATRGPTHAVEKFYYCDEGTIEYSRDELRNVSTSFGQTGNRGRIQLSSFHFLDDQNGWVGGYNSVYRTSNGGISWVQYPVSAPLSASLGDIFPNPARTGATVEFSVAGDNTSDVTLTIYDMMGRKLKSLYEGRKEPGKHSLYFDCSVLRNGMYFVRLQTKDGMKVKKMMVAGGSEK